MTKRGRRGEGYVYQGSDGRWVAVLSAVGPDGKKKKTFAACKKSGINTEAAAGELLFEMRQEAKEFAGRLQRTEKSSLAAYLDEWYTLRLDRWKMSTAAEYQRIIKKAAPLTKKINMGTVDEVGIELLYSRLKAKGMSDADRQKCHVIIHSALKQAVKWRRLTRNPAANVDAPKFKAKRQTALTATELKALMAAIEPNSPLALMVMLAADSGMRQGELFGLRWENVDLEAGLIHVKETVTEVNGKRQYSLPKSDAGVRSIQVSALVLSSLRSHARGHSEHSGYVFPDANGKPMRRNNFYRDHWRPLMIRAYGEKGGKPNRSVRFHLLRHTSATRLLEAGIAPHVVAERMGHSSPSVTLSIYAHVTSKQRQSAADSFDDAMQ